MLRRESRNRGNMNMRAVTTQSVDTVPPSVAILDPRRKEVNGMPSLKQLFEEVQERMDPGEAFLSAELYDQVLSELDLLEEVEETEGEEDEEREDSNDEDNDEED